MNWKYERIWDFEKKERYNKLVSWSQRKCELCGRFLSKKQRKHCSRCRPIMKKKSIKKWRQMNLEITKLRMRIWRNINRFEIGDYV